MADKPVVFYARPLDSTAGTTINVDFSKDLILDYEQEAPLTTLLNKLKDETTETNEFKFAIGRMAPRSATITVAGGPGAVAGTVAITVDHGEYFVEGDVVEIPTDFNDATHTEQLYIQSVAGNVLTCRAYDPANFGVAQFALNALIRRISSGMIEGSDGRSSSQTVPTVYNQYCQSFEDYFDVTRIQAQNRQYVLAERARLREEARKKHVIDHEMAYWISKKVKDMTTAGKPRYQMGSVITQLVSNVLHYGATLTDAKLYDFMILVHNPMYTAGLKRLAFCSGDILSMIQKMALGGIRITPKETSWGVMITEVAFAGKIWEFVEAPMLTQNRPGQAVVTHPRYLKKRTLISTVYEMNVQNPIAKYYRDGFYSVDAVEQKLEEVFGLIAA